MRFSLQIISLILLSFSCKDTKVKDIEDNNQSIPPSTFSWDNATIYFLLTDRFNNGDQNNDYQRPENNPAAPYRGFKGGDIKGLLPK